MRGNPQTRRGFANIAPGEERVFFDVTDLRVYMNEHDSLTGIQRVVVMILMEAVEILGPDRVFLSFMDTASGLYRAVPGTLLARCAGSVIDRLAAALNVQPAEGAIRPTLEKYRDRKYRRKLQATMRMLHAAIGDERHFRKRRSSIEEWRESRPRKAQQVAVHRDFFSVARPGDVVFLAGASWFRGSERLFGKVREGGNRVVVLIHDLIPVVGPRFVASEHPVNFHDWLLDSLGHVDLYIANSRATGRDMEKFVRAYGGGNPVAVVPLAQDKVPGHAPALLNGRRRRIDRRAYPDLYDAVAVSEHIRAVTKNPYTLVVGTTDIRKNLWSLVQAWSRLIRHEDAVVPKLVIAGRTGAMNGDFEDLMASTGNLGGWVVRVIAPSDMELDYLYRNCLFTAMPSYYEGWGLPIGESLSYGKTAVVSETSSMPEVGGDYVEYCDPHSIDSIYRACLKLATDTAHRQALERRIARADLRSWSDVARDTVAALLPEADRKCEAGE